jgi:hypothetical protein
LRLNYAFTNDITLEIYAEPFAASGRYYDFGELPEPESVDIRTYGTEETQIEKISDSEYKVTDKGEEFIFEASDFNILSFRTNFVLRWEFVPGSTLFLVWQQNKSDYVEKGSLVGITSLWDSIKAEGIDIIALKVSYWLPVD